MKLSEIEVRDPDRWKRYKYDNGDKAFAENPVSHQIVPVKITGGPFMGKMYKVEYDGDPDEGYGMWAEDDTGVWDSKEEGERAIFKHKLAGTDKKDLGSIISYHHLGHDKMKLKDIKETGISDMQVKKDAALNTLAEALAVEVMSIIRSRPDPSTRTKQGMFSYVVDDTLSKLKDRTRLFVKELEEEENNRRR